ncbi:MAG: NUDIX hydrolase [Candidatus Abawacabacteria bacterium]|nr:NUDIX hydrolase [Candidatus Abawacabacteria bacterium]
MQIITNKNIPVVSAIIERMRNGEIEVLIQTRWKPEKDPIYSGTLEIPAGAIEQYQEIYGALKREILEETGLKVTRIKPDMRTKIYSFKDDAAFAFMPFCCQQQIKGGKPWIGFVFLCEVEDSEPVPQENEVKDIRWINKNALREMLINTPEKFFTLQLGVLDYYLNYSQ